VYHGVVVVTAFCCPDQGVKTSTTVPWTSSTACCYPDQRSKNTFLVSSDDALGVKIFRTDCDGSNKYVGVVELTSFPPEVEPMAANGSD